MPAASASLSAATGQPVRSWSSDAASTPIHSGAMFAAVRTTPLRTTAGSARPMGPVQSKWAVTTVATSSTALGVAGRGVLILCRFATNRPSPTSTGAPLTPEPPTSIPKSTVNRHPPDRSAATAAVSEAAYSRMVR